MDMGGYVIIINADKVTVTGNKFNDKLYRSHPTAKPGTLKTETFKQLNEVQAAFLVSPECYTTAQLHSDSCCIAYFTSQMSM